MNTMKSENHDFSLEELVQLSTINTDLSPVNPIEGSRKDFLTQIAFYSTISGIRDGDSTEISYILQNEGLQEWDGENA